MLDKKVLIRFLTLLPPLIGVVAFTYIVKYSKIDSVNVRIPLYQGLTAYFSLILLGFTYIKERYNIIGLKIVVLLFIIALFPVLFYIYNNFDIWVVVLFVIYQFFSSIIFYLLIVNDQITKYLLFACLNSVLMPLTLVLNYSLLLILTLLVIIVFCFIYFIIKQKLDVFKFNVGGISFAKSIFFQSPLIILPLFDYKIAEIIGSANYSDYVVINKYINGAIVLLFSFKQLNLVFSGELSNKNLIIKTLLLLLLLLIVCNFINNDYGLIISITIYSIGVNLCSLLIRSALLNGVSLYFTLTGLISTIVYALIIINFPQIIGLTNSLFINLMFLSTLTPSISVYFYRKYIK